MENTKKMIAPAEATIPVSKVVVHPLVLLSVVDHSTRLFKSGIKKRVVGVLLGSWRAKGILDVSNSFAGMFTFSIVTFEMPFNIRDIVPILVIYNVKIYLVEQEPSYLHLS